MLEIEWKTKEIQASSSYGKSIGNREWDHNRQYHPIVMNNDHKSSTYRVVKSLKFPISVGSCPMKGFLLMSLWIVRRKRERRNRGLVINRQIIDIASTTHTHTKRESLFVAANYSRTEFL